MSTSNEIPMYLVPGRLTDKQKLALQKHVDAYNFDKALEAIGTPIQPCADVETVGVHYEVNLGYYGAPSVWKPRVSAASSKHLPCRDITPLVRRTDMEAQVARVKAESRLDAKAITHRIIRDVSELSDRTSPKCEPDLLLVKVDELEGIICAAINERAAK